jgi:DNA-binding response OmpR family regulator
MTRRTDPTQVVRFGVFELDLCSGELRCERAASASCCRINPALLERPGDLITRDELRQWLWRHDTFVDVEDGLNAAILRLRDAVVRQNLATAVWRRPQP